MHRLLAPLAAFLAAICATCSCWPTRGQAPADEKEAPATPAHSWQPPPAPATAQPQLALASVAAEGAIRLRFWDMVEAYEPREVEPDEEAPPPEVPSDAPPETLWFVRWVGEEVEVDFDLKHLKIADDMQVELPEAELKKRLKQPQLVLATVAGKAVDPFYFQLVRPDLLGISILSPVDKIAAPRHVHDDRVVQPVDPKTPQGPMPLFGIGKLSESGDLEIWSLLNSDEAQASSEDAGDDPDAAALEPPPAWVPDTISPQDYRAYEVDGDPVPPEDLAKRLAEPTPILILSHGKTIDAYYGQAFQPDALVLYLPPRPYQAQELGLTPETTSEAPAPAEDSKERDAANLRGPRS